MPRSSKPSKSSLTISQPAQPDWHKILHEAQHRFGIKRFRPGQKEVLESVFAGRNTLAIMPTGAGKSLTYQLPALFLPHPVLVVSPLIALMQDQQEKAAHAHVVVEKLDSTIHKADLQRAEAEIADGSAQLIYVTPERLQNQEFLAELQAAGGISLLVVDEAHTISQWGHDFRPAFQSIGNARKTLGGPPILALTATATDEVARDILHSLGAEDATRINTGTERENLFFSVFPTVNNQAKVARIAAMLKEEQGTGIIYTASVKSANELFETLTDNGISVGHYHGQMKTRDREQVQQEFMRGDHKVMIATKAFGLGIDKPDIRFVYHFEFPDSLETYYQEAGRAGRDGKPSHAVLLYRLEDKRIQNFFLAGRYPHADEIQAVYEALHSLSARSEMEEPASPAPETLTADAISALAGVGKRRTQVILNILTEAQLVQCSPEGYKLTSSEAPSSEAIEALLHQSTERGGSDKTRLADMMHYAETPNCRNQVIRAYFNEPTGDPCLRCDNCARQYPDQITAETIAAFSRRKGRKPAAAMSEPAPAEQPCQQPVTTVHTAYGDIQTTAPETILHASAEPSPFRKGDNVRHVRFGPGKVLDVHDQIALVDFVKSGHKRLRLDFLTAA